MATEKQKISEAGKTSTAKEAKEAKEVFDVQKIRQLVELMKEFDVNQMELRQGEMRIELRRGPLEATGEVLVRSAAPMVAAPAPVAAAAPAAAPAPAPVDDKNIALIKSPMVGTFYSAPDPNSPAYVKVGDHVGSETTVCIVEAMKVFNEIPSEVSGKVIAVLVENGDPVEFGQPLFKVDIRG